MMEIRIAIKDKQCKAPARVFARSWDGYQFQQPWMVWIRRELQYGWYEFSVRAKDNEGQWSKVVKVQEIHCSKRSADAMPYSIFLPLTTK